MTRPLLCLDTLRHHQLFVKLRQRPRPRPTQRTQRTVLLDLGTVQALVVMVAVRGAVMKRLSG